MPIKFSTVCLFLITMLYQTTMNAQKDTIYYDQDWDKTTKPNAHFYRPLPMEQDGDRTLFKDYYIDGTLQFEAWQKKLDTTETAFFGSDGYFYDGTVIWYYANGHKKTEVNYKNRKQNGPEITYYENGAIKKELEMIEDEQQSSKSYTKDGKLRTELQFKNGRPEEGISDCFIQYKEGAKIGEQLYYENTTLLAYERVCPDKGCYAENTQIYYDKKGGILQENTCDGEEIIEGAEIVFFEGDDCGYVKGIKSITTIKNGDFNGPYTRFDTDGNVRYSGTYKMHEPYEGTFETTENYLTYVTIYTNGTKNGTETVWNKEKKIAEGVYIEGVKQNGSFVVQRQFTGWSKIPIILNLKDGKEEGQQKFYNTARDITMGYYHAKAGKKDGAYAVFDYDGEVLAQATYKDGKPFDGEVLINDEYRLYKNGERVRENVVVDAVAQERMEAFSKGSDTIEGGYNMGGFEMAGSIIFLDTHQFFFSLSVGSLDLTTYGAYHLKNGTLKLQVPEEQKQDFVVYGKNDPTLKDTVQIQYYNYNARSKPVLQLNKQWVTLEDVTQQEEERSSQRNETFQIDLKKLSTLKIGIKSPSDKGIQLNSLLEAETVNDYNSFIIAYNVSSREIKQFENATFTFNGENLVSDGKEKQKRSLSEADKENVLDYIIENRAFPNTIQNGSYTKVKLNSKASTQKIKKYTQLMKTEE
ncbi:hypothetical protein FF125_09480 [Aureibaculum algae]|uniref:Toxin-antitoxin system YwqK family antitoxin n=1 Tax=Aureibaculum algae TaxID=2584122 RepID=A0A5B7TTM4_9FLAO|nr:hypothetical protein [Aureibaculum algae]QCX38651.1 hypothetical protein FF125_09480 [Aureibaculum algae]